MTTRSMRSASMASAALWARWLTGVFAIEQYGGTAGLIEGNPVQVLNQVYGIAIVIVYDVIVSLVLLKIIDMVIGLRVSDAIEQEGLDIALHGESVQ